MKKILALLTVLILIFSLSACKKSNTTSDSSSDAALQTSSSESSDTQSGEDSNISTDEDSKSSTTEPANNQKPNQVTTSKAQTANNKPQTGNNGGNSGAGKNENKNSTTGNNEAKNDKYITYQGVVLHDAHTGYFIGDYISLGLKDKGNNNYEAVYMWQYGGGIPQIIPDRVVTSIFFSQKFPKEYQKDLLMYIYNAMPNVVPNIDEATFDKLFTPEYSKYLYKCMYNGELYLSVVEFENFPKFNYTSAKADQNGNLKFAEDIWILGDGVDKNDKCAINIQNLKLSADKNTITATAKGAKYSTGVTLYRTDGDKWGDWGGNDLADVSAEEFAKMVTIVK